MLPTSMKGDGFYKSHSLIQAMVIGEIEPLIFDAASRVPLPSGEQPFSIVDYGCGEGRNSVIPVRAAIQAVRQRKQEQDICVVHNDLPTNNFNGLFKDIYAGVKDSYLDLDSSGVGRTFVLASASSFYNQVVPDRSVQFGYSSSALHWLREHPDRCLKDHLFHWGGTPAESQHLAELSAQDWSAVLHQRARELAAGARMVVSVAGSLGDMGYDGIDPAIVGQTTSGQKPLDLLNAVMSEMVRESAIDRLAYEMMSIPIHMRTLDQFLAPFRQEALSAAFAVEHARTYFLDCPFYARFKQTGDVQSYAAELVATVRAFTEPMVVRGLTAAGNETTSESRIGQLVFEIYERMKVAVLARPDNYPFNVIQINAVLCRK